MISIVLISGGLDSAVLLAHEAQRTQVQPVYVSVGLAWEEAEQAMLATLLSTPPLVGRCLPLAQLAFEMRDIYPETHWAIRGTAPGYDTPDHEVYLVGRNVVLLTKAAVLAASMNASRIALGILAGNPFPDATPEFFAAQSRALSLGLDREIEIVTPFAGLQKSEVIGLGQRLQVPLELTLSCMSPNSDSKDPGVPEHCGICSKCRERRVAFAAAGIVDRTAYASPAPI